MALSLRCITIDCAEPLKLAQFWAAVLDYRVEDADEEDALVVDPTGQHSWLLFQVVPEGKTVKNRLHFDLMPRDSRAAEVARLLALGARELPGFAGEGSPWTVMQDPEGNEFCVVRSEQERQSTAPTN